MAMAACARRSKALLLGRPYVSSVPRFSAAASDEEHDVVVIGGGYVAAIKAAQLGLKTACIKNRWALGSTSLNVGCIPSKVLRHSSHMYHEAKHSFAGHGINFSQLDIALPAMMAQKDKAVANLTEGIEGLFKKNKGFRKYVSFSELTVDTPQGKTTRAKKIL